MALASELMHEYNDRQIQTLSEEQGLKRPIYTVDPSRQQRIPKEQFSDKGSRVSDRSRF
jgi:hypothetical protein